MSEEGDLSSAIAEARARLDRALDEARQAALQLAELSKRAGAAAPTPAETQVTPISPADTRRLRRGPLAERMRAFVEVARRLAQPFTVLDAKWLTRFSQRTLERFLAEAVSRDFLVRDRRGKYRVAEGSP